MSTEKQKNEHAENYALMMDNFKILGKYIDPVSGKEFPPGQQMLEHPNRVQRRRLDKWRKTGKIQRSDQRMVAHEPNDDGGSCAW